MAAAVRQYTFTNIVRATTVATSIRVAGTSVERRQGLLGETHLGEDSGLWIVPCEVIHTFGMKLSIDAIFLDKKLRVRGLRRGLGPRRIAMCLRADSVIELAAGTIERSLTQLGDRLQMSDQSRTW